MVAVPALLVLPEAVARVEVPWAVALNATAPGAVVSVTLLALDVVDDHLRINGVLRLGTRRDVRVMEIPSLVVSPPGEAPWPMLDARVVPKGPLAWVTWTYKWPGALPGRLLARIDRIVLEYRTGGPQRAEVVGPWEFLLQAKAPLHPQVTSAMDPAVAAAPA